MSILVTGGAGFIGSNFVLDWFNQSQETICVLDALTYAGNLENLSSVIKNKNFVFQRINITDAPEVTAFVSQMKPRAIIHFAAESHVDRSIHNPSVFIQTNVVGTFNLLEAAQTYYSNLTGTSRKIFRFLHVSTDEVYGSLKLSDPAFSETTPFAPNSPYSASKASSDHLVRSYHHTYGLPTLTTNCSNNYGPFQFPEKLIPLIVVNALKGKPLPIYGDGANIRDWIYVSDHCAAIRRVLDSGRIGETYNIGGKSEMTNLQVVQIICDLLQEMLPNNGGKLYNRLITFIKDRPGHDLRYAINSSKIETELGWKPVETFASGIRKTIHWYLEHSTWLENIYSGNYRKWINKEYG